MRIQTQKKMTRKQKSHLNLIPTMTTMSRTMRMILQQLTRSQQKAESPMRPMRTQTGRRPALWTAEEAH